MADYPTNIKAPVTEKNMTDRPVKRAKTGNYIKQAPEQTAFKEYFELSYKYLSSADYQILKDFFKANQTIEFNFTSFVTGDTYTAQFNDMDKIDFEFSSSFRAYSGMIKLKEV
jgi:hypothetical protein